MSLEDPAPNGEGAALGPPRWVLALERAHALTHAAARVLENAPPSGADLAPAAQPIEDAVASIYAAFDRRDDGLAATRAAQADLHVAALVVRSLASVDETFGDAAGFLDDARRELDVALERFSRVSPEAPPPVEDLCAAENVPRLHRIDRPALVPELRVPDPLPPPAEAPPPLPPPKSSAELAQTVAEVKRRAEERRKAHAARAEERARLRAALKGEKLEPGDPLPGFARGRFTAKTRDDFVASRTRECFDEVAMIGMQRAPLLGDPWRFAKVLEERMLTAIDAIAALGGPAIARVERLAIDAPAKDPTRGFAAAMILGCFDGRDTLGAVERIIRHLGPADPEVAAHVAGALKLVPHPLLPQILRVFLADADPALRALAVDVLAYRGLATVAELAAAARDPSPAVAAAALPALGLARAADLGEAIQPARVHDDPALREASWIAMSLGGSSHASDVLASELDGPLAGRAAVALAIVGDERDAARLLDRMKQSPTPGLVNAVGWAGAPEAVPALVDLLTHDDPVVQLTAAYALERITGAGLSEDVDVPPETIAVPDVEEPSLGEPPRLAREISDPRDRPSEGSTDKITQPSIDAVRWRAYWAERESHFKPGLRYRRGSLYAPAVSCWELDALPLTPGERRLLQRELVVRTGQHVRFDPHDFVSVQEEALAEWAKTARRHGTAGAWTRPFHR
ncbi:Hypothetical protein A7982_00556 [Minicystis rosea]|nr:Hypothetical protein A7982_00556 [Minicystis rosea]